MSRPSNNGLFHGNCITLVGDCNTVFGNNCKITGNHNHVIGNYAMIIGMNNRVKGDNAAIDGDNNVVDGNNAIFEGINNKVEGIHNLRTDVFNEPAQIVPTSFGFGINNLIRWQDSVGPTGAHADVGIQSNFNMVHTTLSTSKTTFPMEWLDEPAQAKEYQKLCVICLERESVVVAYPCGHLCLCNKCCLGLKTGSDVICKCLVCRALVNQYIRTFSS